MIGMTKLGIAVLAGLTLCVPAWSRAPLLSVSAPQRGPHGWQVQVTNTYSAAATAYWIEVYVGGTTTVQPAARHWADAVPGPDDYKLAIGPGQTRLISFGNGRWQTVLYKDKAVIYADGTAAGDAAIVSRFARIRAAELNDIAQDLAILSQAQATGQDPAGLVQAFASRASGYATALADGIAPIDDRVCKSVILNLQRADQTPATRYVGLHTMLTHWLAQLRAAAPIAATAQ